MLEDQLSCSLACKLFGLILINVVGKDIKKLVTEGVDKHSWQSCTSIPRYSGSLVQQRGCVGGGQNGSARRCLRASSCIASILARNRISMLNLSASPEYMGDGHSSSSLRIFALRMSSPGSDEVHCRAREESSSDRSVVTVGWNRSRKESSMLKDESVSARESDMSNKFSSGHSARSAVIKLAERATEKRKRIGSQVN